MRARHLLALAAVALATAGCERKLTPAERAAADDRAVAMVEAAQERHGPIKPLSPEQIGDNEIQELRLTGGCAFERAAETQPIVLVGPKRAIMKLDRRPATFASDPGGPQGPLGTWEHYVGKGLSMRIVRAPGDGVGTGQDALEWPARVTVRDEFDRIAFVAQGRLRCGA